MRDIMFYRDQFIFGICDTLDSKFPEANMGPPGSCQPQLGPMLAPWTQLSGTLQVTWYHRFYKLIFMDRLRRSFTVLCMKILFG